jgi:hypothetical protein
VDSFWQSSINEGKATVIEYAPFHLRNGFRLEERHLNFKLVPVIDESGQTVGTYQNLFEVTAECLKDRRSESIKKIEHFTAGEEDPATFFKSLVEAVSENGMLFVLTKL